MLNVLLDGLLHDKNLCTVCKKETPHRFVFDKLEKGHIFWTEWCTRCERLHPNKVGYTSYYMTTTELKKWMKVNKMLSQVEDNN